MRYLKAVKGEVDQLETLCSLIWNRLMYGVLYGMQNKSKLTFERARDGSCETEKRKVLLL